MAAKIDLQNVELASEPFDEQAFRAGIRAILPAIAARAADTERNRRVPDESIAELRQAGLFKLTQPLEYGGYEQDFDLLNELIMEISAACASTGWVCGVLTCHQWMLATCEAQAQQDIWGSDPEALLCGSYAPAATAQVVEGGYRLTGRWSFASGCDNAQWAFCAAIMPQGEGRAPRAGFLLVPQSDYRIDDDWHVIGLAGTGSKTLVLDDVFVPAHRVLFFDEATAGRTPGARHYRRNPIYTIPMLPNVSSCIVSPAIGAAQGALDHYVAMVGTRTTRGAVAGGASKMAEFPTIQIRVAEAAASVDAAREILLRDLRRRAAIARTGRLATVEERIESRRGQAFAVKLSLAAIEALNSSTGGRGLNVDNPIQRAWRDVNAVGRHFSFNWDAVGSMYGQMVLGLELRGQY
ncbi:acyl-CoA dehydrogenase family protein [Sphingomonas sp.]|uniref:acyl-CoA dehydrogenase family protein n=1 Tax=Sphingomonas sp. TaxID=28214 RepID=UPI002FC71E1E